MRVLGMGAYGDPEKPWLSRDEFDAGEAAPETPEATEPTPVTPLFADLASTSVTTEGATSE